MNLDAPLLTQYIKADTKDYALAWIQDSNDNYNKVRHCTERITPLNLKHVLNVLRRAANNKSLIKNLQKKIKRFDNDTIELLGLTTNNLPSPVLINERITVLENYRKLHNTSDTELKRYHCATLKIIFNKYGKNPSSHLELRKFVVVALDFAGIDGYPDPNKHGDLLDDWINTEIRPLEPARHNRVANHLINNPK